MARNTRCRILAHLIPGFEPKDRVLRCPTTAYKFHYHGAKPEYSVLSVREPCSHRHQDVNSAVACSEKLHAQGE